MVTMVAMSRGFGLLTPALPLTYDTCGIRANPGGGGYTEIAHTVGFENAFNGM